MNDLLNTKIDSHSLIFPNLIKVDPRVLNFINIVNVEEFWLGFASQQLQSGNIVVKNMGLKEYLRNLSLLHIEFKSLVVIFDRLYWFVNILIVDEVS